jgi:hypothetical protein
VNSAANQRGALRFRHNAKPMTPGSAVRTSPVGLDGRGPRADGPETIFCGWRALSRASG